MADLATPTAQATQAADVATIAERNRAVDQTAAEKSSALMTQAIAAAEKAFAREAAGLPEEEPKTPQKAGKDPVTGKFVKAGEGAPAPKMPQLASKAAARVKTSSDGDSRAAETANLAPPESQTATQVPTEETNEETGEQSTEGSLAKARRLVAEGKFEDAFKYAFGKTLDELPIEAKHWHAWRQQTKRDRAEVSTERAKVEKAAEQLVQAYEPLVQARKALAAGDLHGFIKLATGMSVNDFQQRLFHGFASRDPAIADLQRQLAEEKQERTREKQEREQTAKKSEEERQVADHRSGLERSLKASGDARFAKLASKPAFISKVHDIQREHFDGATTLPPIEAAELAWEELYADAFDSDDTAARGQSTHNSESTTDPARKQARQPGRKAGRSLDHSAASEATSGGTKLRGQALLDHYIAQAQAKIAREEAGIG